MVRKESKKTLTLDAIRNLPYSVEGEDREQWLKRDQRKWLSAIVGKGYEPADQWYTELESDPDIGVLLDHPSFNSYIESWSGPGPSPYTLQEILGFATKGTLIAGLNNFQEENAWLGPTIRALVDELVETVKANSSFFLTIILFVPFGLIVIPFKVAVKLKAKINMIIVCFILQIYNHLQPLQIKFQF